MTNFMKKAGLALVMGATVLTAAAPADAQRWRGGYAGYHHRGGIGTGGAAILGGIVGLGVGAAIASSNRPYYRGGYYDRGYGYGYPRAGYAYDYPPPPAADPPLLDGRALRSLLRIHRSRSGLRLMYRSATPPFLVASRIGFVRAAA